MAKPIVKWAGGKTKLLSVLRARLPARIGTYVEPFAGGAALFFSLEADPTRHFERAVLADTNAELITCYRAVKDDVEAVIAHLAEMQHDEAEYYRVRAADTALMTDAERAARLIYLNRTCYNGLWRVNRAGKFNVPFGRYDNPRILDADGLREASRALARATLETRDFAEVTADLGPGDFVYFDPPYVPVSKTSSFTAYGSAGFDESDQVRLLGELGRLRERGVLVMLSNADTEATRALYRDYAVFLTLAPRAINSRGARRGPVGELIVTSWGEAGTISGLGAASAAKERATPRP
jgi:DNA adenine methylase